MASDLSSGCTEVIEILDEKEEGEISLEDVSSSEEGQLNDGCNSRRRAAGQCPSCLSTKHCASWCRMPTKRSHSKSSTKKDAVQEKENCHHTKDSGYSGSKHSASTLQENNNDLIPISSDSDMEIVGLADNAKPSLVLPQTKSTKVRKRRRKRWSSIVAENIPITNPSDVTTPECSIGTKRDSQILKDNHLPRAHRRESTSPHKPSASPFARSRVTKSPLRRHRSPFGRTKSPPLRKSPNRKPRSPARRSPPLAPTKSPAKRLPKTSISPAYPSLDTYDVSKLLKKVRHLKTVGTHSSNRNSCKRKRRGPSLKDKLTNMMKNNNASDNVSNQRTGASNSEKKLIEDVDDEEDLDLLRKMALETKPKKNDKVFGGSTENKEKAQQSYTDIGDDDVEDLELRMIALRSAMLKKHKDRMQRGVVPAKTKKPASVARDNTESPFSQSFLDSIPIPGEGNEEKFKTPQCTPTQVLSEIIKPEDMELDSEVELEKEKGSEPYSPTDDISREINVDSELLGIQPSDVLFITPTSQASVVSNNSDLQTSESEKLDILEIGASYLSKNKTFNNHNLLSTEPAYYSDSNVLPSSQSPTSSIYSSINPIENLATDSSIPDDDNLPATPYSPSQPIDTPKLYFYSQDDAFLDSDPNRIPDTPYSPTDTPIYDPDFNKSSSFLLHTSSFQESDIAHEPFNNPPRLHAGKKWCTMPRQRRQESALIEIPLVANLPKHTDTPLDNNLTITAESNSELLPLLEPEKITHEKDDRSETSSMQANVGSAISSSDDSPDTTMIIVDELPETDLDGSPLVSVSREIEDIEIHIPAAGSQEIKKIAQEPLYLQGVPDVTKDANKIPTLVNRSLVPASILKSNKNLQQPLPPKKIDAHLEPAFKSAEMQPVQISAEITKTNRLFKPIKLAPVAKKPKLKIVTPAVFNCSSNDTSVLEDQGGSDNFKPVLGNIRNNAGNLLENLQNSREIQAPNKMLQTTDFVQSEIDTRTAQPIKPLVLPVSEQLTNLVQDKDKYNDTSRISNRKSVDNPEENFIKEKKTRSRRSKSDKSKSKHTTKIVRDDINTETKNTTGTGVSSNDKPNLLKDSVPKKKNLKDKLKKVTSEKSKKDREQRKDKKSGKDTDTNDLNDYRTSIKKQEPINKKMLEATERPLQNSSVSVKHRENMDIDSTENHSQEASNIIKNTVGEKSSVFGETDVNILNAPITCTVKTKFVEKSENNFDVNTQDRDYSISNNMTCKKVEAGKRRRSSFDDDEETLRAILLASLAKRSKPSDPINSTSKTTTLANLSFTSGNTSTESVKNLPNTPGSKIPVSTVYSSGSDTTPPLLGNSSSISNNFSSQNPNLVILTKATISDAEIAKNIIPNNMTHDKTPPATAPMKRKLISSIAKAPLKKVAKKVPISASTKVVNNAKKYQNTLVQKKLNLQKVATITNAQITLSRTNLHNNKVLDGGSTRSMITQPLSDTQRFVINLASDSESENEVETPEKNVDETMSTVKSEQKPALAIPMSDFEKSVDLFLKDVRKKQETAAAVKPSSITNMISQKSASPITSVHRKSPVLSTTPLAVRHLPVSLQEEYRRLKQQILEREKLKLHRGLANNMSPLSPSSKSSGTPPGPLSPASPIASPTISKQTHNIPPNSQTAIATASKDSIAKSVSIQNNLKKVVSGIETRVSTVASKSNAPIASVSNLSIQIPNEMTNINLTCKKSVDSYTSASTSQTRVVTAVKVTQDSSNTKDLHNSAISAKNHLGLTNVQIQLQQGRTGRRVSLGETLNLNVKIPPVSENEGAEVQESAVVSKVSVNNNLKDSNQTVNAVDIRGKCDNTVDSSASTLIISREEEKAPQSSSVDSSASTIIISRTENLDSSKAVVESSESTTADLSISKSLSTGARKSKNNLETWEKIRGDVKNELDVISALPTSEQKSYLAAVEQNLVKKRYAILDDLSEISGNLRQLEMERAAQSQMALEVKKLQEQLKLAEERLHAQRSHVNKMVPSISAAYEKFNSEKRECIKMTKFCLGLGCLVIGANYKIPAAGVQLLNDRLKQVAGCTRQLSSKKSSITRNAVAVMQHKSNLSNQLSNIDNCLDSCLSESTQNAVPENNMPEGEDSVTLGTITVIDNSKNSTIEFIGDSAVERTDKSEQYTLKLGELTVEPFVETILHDSPQLTSTPNSSKETSSAAKNEDDSGSNISRFVLDSPGAGTSGKENNCLHQRSFLQPYKSVLRHLIIPR